MVLEIVAVVLAMLAAILKNKWVMWMAATSVVLYLGQINVITGGTALLFAAAIVGWLISLIKG